MAEQEDAVPARLNAPKLRLFGLILAVASIVSAILLLQQPWRGGTPATAPASLPTAASALRPGDAAVTPPASGAGNVLAGSPSPKRPAPPPGAEDAPELEGIYAWVNSAPLTLASLRGKVVLLDFWTYTCVNCIRTLPYLKQWYSSYRDLGFVIIGVHSPEFQFEHELTNVQQAVIRHGLKYPVALDNDFKTWNNFRSRAWPTKYLIDKDGYIRYRHIGEGGYAETEERIQELLQEAGIAVAVGSAINPMAGEFDPTIWARTTIELYLGYRRFSAYSYLGNPEGHQPDYPTRYNDYGLRRPNQFYLHGYWTVTEESLDHARGTQTHEDYIVLQYSARSVNLVMKPRSSDGFRSLVTLDGAALSTANKGDDVVIESDGRSYLVVREPRMYNVVKDREFSTHELKIYADSEVFSAFAFTFGPGEDSSK